MARPTRVIGTAADEERTAGRTRLRLSNADAAERRIDVESVGRNAIVHPPPLAIQEVRGDDLEIVIGGMSEGAATVAVTQRPDVRRAGTQLVIHNDVAARVDRDSSLVEL
jgi:hypothetical protein